LYDHWRDRATGDVSGDMQNILYKVWVCGKKYGGLPAYVANDAASTGEAWKTISVIPAKT
jgi:hypothetical protein